MDEEFQIHFAKGENFAMRKFHYHDHYEIYYLFAGERYYYIENRTYYVQKGSMIFIKKNDIHKTIAGGKLHERAVVYFTDRFVDRYHGQHMEMLLSPFINANKIIELNNLEQNYIENLIFQMNNEYTDRSRQGRSLYCETLLVQLLLFASRKLKEDTKASHMRFHPKISEVIEFCNANFTHSLTMEGVASRFFISPFHFSRLFKRYTGFNFTEYIHTLRIREAQRLLRETQHKVIEIAEQVGYVNITHFNRKFKQVARMSPMEYKKMIKSS